MNWNIKVNQKASKPEIQCLVFKQGLSSSATNQILPIVAKHRVDDERMLSVFENGSIRHILHIISRDCVLNKEV